MIGISREQMIGVSREQMIGVSREQMIGVSREQTAYATAVLLTNNIFCDRDRW
jgi:uncharacterized protein YjiS (DUF1127 family)